MEYEKRTPETSNWNTWMEYEKRTPETSNWNTCMEYEKRTPEAKKTIRIVTKQIPT